MSTLSVEERIETLLTIMATATEFKPDFAAAANALGLGNNSNVKSRFKSIVEADKKFILQSTKGCKSVTTVVMVDHEDGANGKTAPNAPKSKKRSKKDIDGTDEEAPAAKRARKETTEGIKGVKPEDDIDTKGKAEHEGQDAGASIEQAEAEEED